MPEFILHHYPSSPFSEKLRLILGWKRHDWASVIVPVVAPKPDVVALTGGYRRTPVAQVGADVYCDTALIARLIEARAPTPTLYPVAAPLAEPLAQWADATLFWTMIAWVMQPAGRAAIFEGAPPEALKAFATDRAAFTAGMKRQTPADARVALGRYLASLEAQLATQPAGSHLLGAGPCIADFSVAHALWFIRRAPPVAEVLAPHPRLNAWLDEMLAIGHGNSRKLDGTEALAIAAAAGSHAPTSVAPGAGFEAGAAVTITPLDYGFDPVAGELVGLDDDEVVVRRHDPRAGTVHVHFPRLGFQVLPDAPSKGSAP